MAPLHPLRALRDRLRNGDGSSGSKSNDLRRQYSRLKKDDHIRLLHLEPGELTDPIVCKFFHVRLKERPDYEALSYTWGSTDEPANITCNGQIVSVRRNLYNALRRLRFAERQRTLWIDALCINQTDAEEKTAQVRLMKLIFENARHVQIWLGKAEESTEDVISLMESFLALHDRLPGAADFSDVAYTPEDHNYSNPELSQQVRSLLAPLETWTAVGALLKHPWFNRAWVLQESIYAVDSTFMIGPYTISWSILTDFVDTLSADVKMAAWYATLLGMGPDPLLESLIYANKRRKNIASGTILSRKPSDALRFSRRTAATLPVDKIFAVASLCEAPHTSPMYPDYSKGVVELYTDISLECIEDDGDGFLMLRFAIWDASCGHILGLPSWVIDWTQLRTSISPLEGKHYRAGGDLGWRLDVSADRKRLTTNGKYVGTIENISSSLRMREADATKDRERMPMEEKVHLKLSLQASWVSDILSLISSLKPYPTGEDIDTVLCRTLVADYDIKQEKVNVTAIKQCYDSFMHWNMTPWDYPISPTSEDLARFDSYVSLSCMRSMSRSVCSTSTGYIGLMPPHARNGDQIFVFTGSRVPFVLRRNDDETFVFIGKCYIHGVMEGAIMGSNEAEIRTLTMV